MNILSDRIAGFKKPVAKRKQILFLLVFLPLLVGVFTSCTTFNTTSGSFARRDITFKANDKFLLRPVKIISYGFLEEEEAEYILNEKLFYELNRDERFRVRWYRKQESPGQDYMIVPELIVKPYTNSYLDRNLYILRILIIKKGKQVCYFRTEYNGSSSIFERRVLDSLVGGFVKDFKKFFK